MMVLAACRACHQATLSEGGSGLPRVGSFRPARTGVRLPPLSRCRLRRRDVAVRLRRRGLPKFLSIEKACRSQAEVLKAKKKAGKSGVDREWPIFKRHSQLAFGEAQSILRSLASTASGRRIVAAQTARKTKAKEDTL
jgi:hypothetical protein